jgi:hypothetical protein
MFDSQQAYSLRRVLTAAGLSRVYEHMAKGTFAIVSASRGEAPDNAKRTATLKEKARAMGLGFMPAVGVWEGASEDSLFIPDASKEQAEQLGNAFEQDAVIWGDGGFYWLIELKSGAENGPFPVEDAFHHMDQGEDAQYFTEMKGKKWRLAPEAPVETEVQPAPVVAKLGGIKVKGKAFGIHKGFDLEREGQPFFFWTGNEKFAYLVPNCGFAVHDKTEGPNLNVGAGGYDVRGLAVYIPFVR